MKIASLTIVFGLGAIVPAVAQHLHPAATVHPTLIERLAQVSSAVPEPVAVALLAAGIAALGARFGRRKP